MSRSWKLLTSFKCRIFWITRFQIALKSYEKLARVGHTYLTLKKRKKIFFPLRIITPDRFFCATEIPFSLPLSAFQKLNSKNKANLRESFELWTYIILIITINEVSIALDTSELCCVCYQTFFNWRRYLKLASVRDIFLLYYAQYIRN